MQQRVQVLGSALLCVHRVFLFLGGFLGGLTDPVEMALGFLNTGSGLARELSWVLKLGSLSWTSRAPVSIQSRPEDTALSSSMRQLR